MEPSPLIGPASTLGYPAPYWFLLGFKVLGFILHSVPMSLWLAGTIAAMLLNRYGHGHARRFASRLMQQMPLIIAAGVNLGIVPLLFTQVAYYRVFYPATILMAWPWLSIIVMLAVAYYGVYLHVLGLRGQAGWLKPYTGAAGWLAALLFILIGFFFTNGFSLMTNVGAWRDIWQHTSIAAAPLGTALNSGDPTLLPRFLMFLGLALTTLGAYALLDAAVFAGRESPEYHRAMPLLALKIRIPGLLLFALCGTWYFFGALPQATRDYMFSTWHAPLTVLTALSPGLACPFVLLLIRRFSRALCVLAAVVQFAAIALNAVSRQIVQNFELKPYLDVAAERVNMQWSPLILFLLLFVAGLGVLIWMIVQVAAVQCRELKHQPAGKKH